MDSESGSVPSSAELEFSMELARHRRAAKLSQKALALKVAFTREYLSRAEKPGGSISPGAVKAIDAALGAGGLLVKLHAKAVADRKARRVLASEGDGVVATADGMLAELQQSETAVEVIQHLGSAVDYLSTLHSQVPPRLLLTRVQSLHAQLRRVRLQKMRLSQSREIYRIESDLLSHACVLYGDLEQNETAEKIGNVALALAVESGASEAFSRSVLAKTLRWSDRLVESLVMARSGYERSPRSPIRIQLASQEANAAALLGDSVGAFEALRRAEQAAEASSVESENSVRSFSVGRQAIFRLSVATHSDEPQQALAAACAADAAWASGEPYVVANWAQIRLGSGIAHLILGSLEEAQHEVSSALAIPPDLRVSTVTAYAVGVAQRLGESRFRNDRAASNLREEIDHFNREALPH